MERQTDRWKRAGLMELLYQYHVLHLNADASAGYYKSMSVVCY